MKLPPEVNLLGVAHYLEALEYQYKANQVVSLFGGKNPHIQTVVVGGVALAINLDNEAALNIGQLTKAKVLLEQVRDFVQQVYLIDVAAIGALYAEWFKYGRGVDNYLAVPDMPLDTRGETFDLPGGTIFSGELDKVTPIKSFHDPYFRDNVAEAIVHSWYEGSWIRHPWEEETVPSYTDFDPEGKYSWAKAPRFKGEPMQVGPLAQVLVGYGLGHKLIRKWTDFALAKASAVAGRKLKVRDLCSTPGRHLARAIRAAVLADLALKHLELLTQNISRGDQEIYPYKNPPDFPKGEIKGFGFHEAPRGALSHWVVIKDGVIKNYQCVVPSTWNVSPRDGQGKRGPYEASLLGNPVADPKRPLEVLRTVHSFDPCIACAVHILNPRREEIVRVKAL
jgi:hydrogenase large subunit